MPNQQPAAMMENLRRLCVMRMIVLGSMLVAIGTAVYMEMPLPYLPIGLALAAMAAITTLTWLRMRTAWPLTNLEFLLQLIIDIAVLGIALYHSGGGTNPFVSYLLVPLCIAAATLPWRLTWLVAVLCIGLYTVLLFFYRPLPVLAVHSHGEMLLNAHVLGMWANFFLSALLITIFVVGMARALRDREHLLNQLREDDLRDEQIMAVATLAAGTAHELGTPLSTMRILLDEIRAEHEQDDALGEDLAILSRQLTQCRTTLKKLVAMADHQRLGRPQQYQADAYFRELLDDWHLLYPETVLEMQLSEQLQQYSLSADATLKQALTNLLNNAREASPDGFSVAVSTGDDTVVLEILDQGAGLPKDMRDQLGRPFVVNSEDGMGIGLLLTHATLSRFGGELTIFNRSGSGTATRAKLPATRADRR